MLMFLYLKGYAEQKYTMKPSSIATRCQAPHELRQILAYSMGIPAGKALPSIRSCSS
ncbi:hypothetical protein SAMN04490194_5237 [Pseudomonas migulae]|jgi:hypothetical protein|uniref:Uncharacterized protein n=1 Tax=Pseudomonas migulae TaxID=78543 RepID=A0A1H5MZ82_9PSED|nr:hypothetical protein SAMN04490194_5237 [Pseudomonas migulae]